MNLRRLGSLVVLVVLYQLARDAVAQEFTSSLSAAELLGRCRHASDILSEATRTSSLDGLAQAAYCAGFVEAAADAGSFLGVLTSAVRESQDAQAQRSIRNCAGPAVRGEELLRVVVRFLENHPDRGEQAAVAASMHAIARAFPCDTRA